MRAIGAHQGLSPVLDVCRDPRWGRLEETYGEDPYLVAADGRRPSSAGCRATTSRDGASSPPPSTSSGTAHRRAASTGRPPTCPSASCATSTCARSRRRCATPGWRSVMNGYHELDGMPCGAEPLAADRSAARRVGLRRHRGVGLLLGAPARRATTTSPTDGADAAATALHAGLDVELPGTDCYGAPLRDALDARRDRRSPTSTRPCGRVLDDEVPPRSVRAAVRRRRPGGGPHPHARPDSTSPGRWRATASCCSRTTACSRSAATRFDRRDRTRTPASARNLLGDYSYIAHVESLLDVLASGGATCSRSRSSATSNSTTRSTSPTSATVLDALRRRPPRGDRDLRRGMRRRTTTIARASTTPWRLAASSRRRRRW